MVFSQLLGLAINVTFGRNCDTMVQREEIPNVWQAASRSTLGIHANWNFGVQPRRGAYRDKWLATQPIKLPQRLQSGTRIAIHGICSVTSTLVLILEHTKCASHDT